MERIKSCGRSVLVAVKAAAATVARLRADSWNIELTQPTVSIPCLPTAWDGARIALIADLHVGRFVSLRYVRKVVETTNGASPDIIAVAGDLISQAAAVRASLTDALKHLYAARLPKHPRVDLALCGHTHGGQIKPPLLPPPVVPVRHRKYAAGLQSGPACQVYTSRGLEVVGVPFRFNCRPELPVVILRQG